MLFGGHRGPAHAQKPSGGDADMWDGSDEQDAGAELFSNLSVTCCMSPTGDDLATFSKAAVRHHICHVSSVDELTCMLGTCV